MSIPTKFRWIIVLGSIGILTSCVPGLHIREVPIRDAAPPSAFSTYRWQAGLLQEATVEERIDTGYSTLIQLTMDRAMKTLGYTRADDDKTAMILAFQLTVEDTAEAYDATQASDSLGEPSEYGLRWRLPQGESPVRLERLSPEDNVTYFAQGILHVGAFSPDLEPIWHVMGHKILDPSHTPAEHRMVLQTTVGQLMQRLPSRRIKPTE